MRFRFLIVILVMFYCSTEACQTDTAVTAPADTAGGFFQADSIQIFGNEKTNESIILRELTFSAGDRLRYADLNYNRERIYSLGLFTDVQIIPDAGKNRVIIAVEESWYFWPIPFVNLKDNSLDRATYGMNVSYKNFRGMNETITGTVGLGYDPFAGVEYISPWFIKEKNLSLSASLAYMKIYNKNLMAEQLAGGPFSQKTVSGGATLGKRLDIFNVVGISAGFDYVESPKEVPGINAEKGRIDRTLKAGVFYNYDSRNLKQFPDSGLYFYASAMQKGFGIKNVNYTLLSADYRQYLPLFGGLSVKWRLASKFALGENIPFYDYSDVRYIRGHFREFRQGHYSYTGQLEMKYPIVREWDLKFSLPLLPEALTSYRIGIYPYLFTDTGGTQMKNEKLSSDNFYSGYGGGFIILFLPYNIFRLEMAFDEYKNREFLVGFDFSF